MDKRLETAINEQITKEFYSSNLYLSMAAYFEKKSLSGFSHWMRMQAQEENLHGMKLFDYLCERGCDIVLEAIDKPPVAFKSIEDVFQKTLAHEKTVTASINKLYSLARDVNDNAALGFLQWFVDEQVEEEKNAGDILGKLKYVNNQPAGILFLDKELSARAQPLIAPVE